jgi:hypothetical protein
VSIFQTQKNFFNGEEVGAGPKSGVILPDYKKISNAFNIPFKRCDNHDDLDRAIFQTMAVNGPAIFIANNWCLSVQSVSTGTGVGTIKIQVSNDSETGVPVNWSDLSGATIAVTAASVLVLPKIEVSYQFIRLVYTKTSGTGTLNARVKSIGF